LWQGSPRSWPHPDFEISTARRCRSSVVEHPLGKGEVVSSILTGSTIFSFRVFNVIALLGTTWR
jgi:hypothetical protein